MPLDADIFFACGSLISQTDERVGCSKENLKLHTQYVGNS